MKNYGSVNGYDNGCANNGDRRGDEGRGHFARSVAPDGRGACALRVIYAN
jgi:hypothetical protein